MRGRCLLLIVCLTASVGLSGQSRSVRPAAGWFELPVSGGQETLDTLGLTPEDRGIALWLIGRSLYGTVTGSSMGPGIAVQVTELFGAITRGLPRPLEPGTPATVLAPLSDSIWRRALEIPDDGSELFPRLALFRAPMLVLSGTMTAGPGVRTLLDRDHSLLRTLIKVTPGVFAAVAPALDIVDGRVTVPGGQPADGAWAALVGASPGRPADFIRALCTKDDGRIARFFATMMDAQEPHLGALLAPPGVDRHNALRTLYNAARNAEPVWSVNDHPFQRGNADLSMVLRVVRGLDPAALPPTARLWPDMLTERIRVRRDADRVVADAPASVSVFDLVRAMLTGSPRERRDHLAMIAIARQRFGDIPSDASADAVFALSAMAEYRALLLTLDRLDISTPSVWAAAVAAARHLDEFSGRDRTHALTAFQGGLAIIERARLVRSIDRPTAERLVLSLARAAEGADPVAATAAWIVKTLSPALPELVRPDRLSGETAYESRILQALAGPPGAPGPTVVWEGQTYRVDLAAGEFSRLQRIRAIVSSPGLDQALAGGRREEVSAALLVLAYLPALGDPEGPVMLSPDVVTRHDFGVGSHAPGGESLAWQPPVERTGDGQPWRVVGALMGLDLGLARLALRRLSTDEMPPVPTINLNDELVLARTVMTMNPYDLDDDDRDAIVAALDRGRVRLRDAGRDAGKIEALAREAGLPGTLRHTLAWTLGQPGADPAVLFGLRDLYWLGRPALEPARAARWGVMGEPIDGRLVTQFPGAEPWDSFTGRPDSGLLGAQVPDLTLRMAEETSRLKLPARLVPALLAYATQDFWHDVEARFPDDWPAMVRRAAAVPGVRVEDYVAALAGDGPLRPR